MENIGLTISIVLIALGFIGVGIWKFYQSFLDDFQIDMTGIMSASTISQTGNDNKENNHDKENQ